MREQRTKSECEKFHFKKRMKSRRRIIAKQSVIDYVIKCIQTGKSIFVEKQSNRVVKHDVLFNNKLLHVVYDKYRKQPITVLD